MMIRDTPVLSIVQERIGLGAVAEAETVRFEKKDRRKMDSDVAITSFGLFDAQSLVVGEYPLWKWLQYGCLFLSFTAGHRV